MDLDSDEYAALEGLLEHVDRFEQDACDDEHDETVGYQQVIERVEFRDAVETFRSFTVQALGRVPTVEELAQIQRGRIDGPTLSAGTSTQLGTNRVDSGHQLRCTGEITMTVVKQLIDRLASEAAFALAQGPVE